jgi:hypothetical protein
MNVPWQKKLATGFYEVNAIKTEYEIKRKKYVIIKKL